jgi:hypothetical protein
VGLLCKDTVSIKVNALQPTVTFEYMDITISHASDLIRLLIVYRPPATAITHFLEEFANLTDHLNLCGERLLIVGDFNIHVDNNDNKDAKCFLSNLAASNLEQHVNCATHVQGHTLDLVITRPSEFLLDCTYCDFSFESDHALVYFDVAIAKFPCKKQTVVSRTWKSVDMDKFKADISNKLIFPADSSASQCVDIYNSVLSQLVDEYAPLKKRSVTVRPSNPWYTTEIAEAKRFRRKLERQWLRTGLHIHLEIMKAQRHKVTSLISEAKRTYLSSAVEAAKDQKVLFSITKKLVHKVKCTKLPSSTSDVILAEKFSDYFSSKISKIREDIEEKQK